jgi:hypothetical protein
VKKYCRAGQATDDGMAHAHCMLYKATNTLRICNTYCFSLQQWLLERALFYVVRTLRVLFSMPVIDWRDVSETTFLFLVGPWFIMFARMHIHIFVAHSYYNPFTPCEYFTVQ